MIKRKVVQACVCSEVLVAVCDDGSMWQYVRQQWKQYARIPDRLQDEESPEEESNE